ncbi:hypothetical protein [Polluticoccus soli]|uniref:hypothetical protein n=1 Tax=Polluticoccus soli TaxID=3034150 RepID=UPI0023E2FC2B|nr:hypothetical protein [Flavipsychrobacter sp. JY13-12]
MLKVVEISSIIFTGSPSEVQDQLSAFLKDKSIRIYSFVQSQSTVGDSVQITATLLYIEYAKERKEVLGFNTPRY